MTADKRLSIVFVVPRFHTNLYFATKALVERGHAVHLFCRNAAGIEDHTLVTPRYFGPHATVREIWSALRAASPDLLLVRQVEGLSPATTAYGYLHGIATYAYDQRPLDRRRSLRKIAVDLVRGRPMRRVTPVPGLGQGARQDRLARYLPFPVERNPAVPLRQRPPGDPVRIICVGKLTQPRKNQRLLLEALDNLDPGLAWAVTLVGSAKADVGGADPNHLADLMALAARPRSGRRTVAILEDVPFAEMPALYAAHDICVLPSRAEPLGTAPLEAMAYGCVPVISTECGTAGCITDGRDGLLVDVSSRHDLERVLAELITGPERLAALGTAARATAEGDLGMERFVGRVEALIASRD